MKTFCIFLFCFLSAVEIFSQGNGTQLIYQSGNYGIIKCNSIKPGNNSAKNLYIQLGLFNYITSANESGKYLKLNKNTGGWYIPYNGFINANWGVYYPIGQYDCQPIPFFAIASGDSNKIIKFSITPAADCPDAHTYYTKSGGTNYLYTPFNCGGMILFPYGGDYNPKNNSTLIYGYPQGPNYFGSAIYISTNSGDNWSMLAAQDSLRYSTTNYNWISESQKYGFIKYNPFDTTFIYANGITCVYKSTNGGSNFIRTGVNWMKDLIFSYKDSMMYGINKNKLYKSSSKGLQWDSTTTLINFASIEINPDLPNILYAGDSLGVYRSTNYGANWSLYNNTFEPSRFVIGISKDAGSLDTFFVVTSKNVYKVWESNLVGSAGNNNELPEKYSLEQNYPNPFNQLTVIKYHLSKDAGIKIKVYDMNGREIAALINGKKQAGTYEIIFNASELSSGVYFYRMESGIFSETKRMLLIK